MSSCTRDRFVVMYYGTSCVVIEILHNKFLPESNYEFLDDQYSFISRFMVVKSAMISKLRSFQTPCGCHVSCWPAGCFDKTLR